VLKLKKKFWRQKVNVSGYALAQLWLLCYGMLLSFVFRNKDDEVSKVDVVEEFEDESSTKKKKGKKEKKRKKDYDDDDDGDIEDLAKELDVVTLEQGKKDKKQSKVSGVEYICVCVCFVVCA